MTFPAAVSRSTRVGIWRPIASFQSKVLNSFFMISEPRPSHCKTCPGSLPKQQPQAPVLRSCRQDFLVTFKVWIPGFFYCSPQRWAPSESEPGSLFIALPQVVTPCHDCPCPRVVSCPLPRSWHPRIHPSPATSRVISILKNAMFPYLFPFLFNVNILFLW